MPLKKRQPNPRWDAAILALENAGARCLYQGEITNRNNDRRIRCEEWMLPRTGHFVLVREFAMPDGDHAGVDLYTNAGTPMELDHFEGWLRSLNDPAHNPVQGGKS